MTCSWCGCEMKGESESTCDACHDVLHDRAMLYLRSERAVHVENIRGKDFIVCGPIAFPADNARDQSEALVSQFVNMMVGFLEEQDAERASKAGSP